MMSAITSIGLIAGLLIMERVLKSKHADLLRVSFAGVASFLKFMAVVSILRLVIISQLGLPPIPPELADRSILSFWPVFWEDAVFTLPILFWERYSNPSKWLVYPVLAASAIFFGMGHLYQGIMGGVMAAFYLFVISYGYGKKHGLGTVMICHVLYDMLTFWVIQSSQ